MRWIVRGLVALAVLLVVVGIALRVLLGGGDRLEDRTTAPVLPAEALELVVDLDYPPGNIAVSRTGRVFFTLHPDGSPPEAVHELIDGRAVPFRPADAPPFETALSLRIDQKDRLWVLDHADFGQGQPRITAFDLESGRLVHRHDFASEVAGLFSMLNDFQVDPTGRWIYIAEASPIVQTPAIVVYDTVEERARRVLHRHASVIPEDLILRVGERDMVILGLVTMRIGVDSIALDSTGEWLYYGPVNGRHMYRVPTAALRDASLSAAALGDRVEVFGPKPLSDGLSMDTAGSVYVTDPEHGAVLALRPDRTLLTLVKDARLRWPDGLGFGPDGWLYVTCSALQHVLFTTGAEMRANAPYQIYRFKPGPRGVPGH